MDCDKNQGAKVIILNQNSMMGLARIPVNSRYLRTIPFWLK